MKKQKRITETRMMSKCGFVSIVGRTNSGKSTLLNYLVGEKISIVSRKVQTTRQEIRGIIQYKNSQIIFVDTPGFCSGRTSLEKALLLNFKRAYNGSDIVLLLIDCTSKNWKDDILYLIKNTCHNYSHLLSPDNKSVSSDLNFTCTVVFNKVDKLLDKTRLLKMADELKNYTFIKEIFMISALTGKGVDQIIKYLAENVPESPWLYFDYKEKTDQNLQTRLSEITREAIYEKLNNELPYNIYIQTDKISVTDKKIKLIQSIIVTKDSQKGIVLGHKGNMIKLIRHSSITKMRNIFSKNIELKLFVLVRKNWTEKKEHLINAGII